MAVAAAVAAAARKSVAFNLEDAVRDLDSATTTDSVSTDILLNVISGLYRLDVNTRPVPDMAESVDISEDQLTYTFTLRDGIKWSNGDPVTAQDFEYAWKRVLNPDTGAQYAYIITTFVKGADEYNTGEGSADDVAVKATDDKTLEVELVAPSPFWLGLTSFFTYLPQNQKFVEEQGEDYALSKEALIFNGPYMLTSFKPTEGATMVKNEDYWNKANVPIAEGGGQDSQGARHRRKPLRVRRARRAGHRGRVRRRVQGLSRVPYRHLLRLLLHGGKPEGEGLPEPQRPQGHPDRLRQGRPL